MRDTNDFQRDQRGMVAILVTMIMMLVITLIVIGFAQIVRRNQRSALDRQLSSQAYYAAESGVNDATQYIKNNLANLDDTSVIPADASTNCASFMSKLGGSNVLSTGSNVSYTCLLVNPHPPTITTKPLLVNKSAVWPLKSQSGAWTSLTFSWTNNSSDASKGLTCPTPVGKFTALDKWPCSYGILRVDLIDGTTVSSAQDGDSSNVATFYMVPSTSGGSVAYKTGAAIVPANCPTTGTTCTVNVTGLSSATYYARLTMMYEDSDVVSVSGQTATGAGNFTDAAVVIDATGKAQDELRRIQVVVPLTSGGTPLPTNAVQSTGGVCKYFTIAPGDLIPAPGNLCN